MRRGEIKLKINAAQPTRAGTELCNLQIILVLKQRQIISYHVEKEIKSLNAFNKELLKKIGQKYIPFDKRIELLKKEN